MSGYLKLPIVSAGGASDFTTLTDTPSTYSGQTLKHVRVNAGETALEFFAGAGVGDVVGPASSIDNSVVRFNGTTGKLIQDSSNVIIDDDGRIAQNSLGGSTFLGLDAGFNDDLTSNDNVCIGVNSGKATTSGSKNIYIGKDAGQSCLTQSSNTIIGWHALSTASSAGANTAVGSQALGLTDIGDKNTALGTNSMLFNTSGHENIGVGHSSVYACTTGIGNVGLGYQTGNAQATGSYNVYAGYQAGKGAAGNHSNNVFLGGLAGDSVTTGSDNIVIGYDQDLPTATTNDHLNIGGTIYGDLANDKIGIGEVAPAGTLHTNQVSTTAAIPALVVEQGDIDDTFINFIGTSAADGTRSISSDTTEDSTKFGAIRVEINGVSKWIRIYDNES